jgi:hypothetical protein
MENRTIVRLGAVAPALVVFVFDVFLAAEASTTGDSAPLPEGATVLSEGRFEGAAGMMSPGGSNCSNSTGSTTSGS